MFLNCLVFVVLCVYSLNAQIFFEDAIGYPGRVSCGKEKFRCNSNQCIDKNYICDGEAQCSDMSDETETLCSTFICPRYSYRCEYGACVYRGSACNGIVDCIDGSDEMNCDKRNQLSPSSKRESSNTKCGYDRFECTSGQCLNFDQVCDGFADCDDRSDETLALCTVLNCPSYTFRCNYGACIKTKLKCNGIKDCADGSDEFGCTSSITPVEKSGKCLFPRNPRNGAVSIGGSRRTYKTGDKLPEYSVLLTKCNKEVLNVFPGETRSICVNGVWEPEPPNCSKMCPSINSVTEIECRFEHKLQESCETPEDGTVVLIFCEDLATATGSVQTLVRVCRNGKWSSNEVKCNTGLGSKIDSRTGNIHYKFS